MHGRIKFASEISFRSRVIDRRLRRWDRYAWTRSVSGTWESIAPSARHNSAQAYTWIHENARLKIVAKGTDDMLVQMWTYWYRLRTAYMRPKGTAESTEYIKLLFWIIIVAIGVPANHLNLWYVVCVLHRLCTEIKNKIKRWFGIFYSRRRFPPSLSLSASSAARIAFEGKHYRTIRRMSTQISSQQNCRWCNNCYCSFETLLNWLSRPLCRPVRSWYVLDELKSFGWNCSSVQCQLQSWKYWHI